MLDDKGRDDALKRLKRIEGQVRGIARMIESEKYCVEVLTQIAAAQGALDKVAQMILEAHLHTCVTQAVAGDDPLARDEKLRELADVFARFGRR